ncbi:MAG: 3-oxoacyl-(acyl-carrier-protein) reductase [Thermoleophilia bacterium]|nr:3-oxoacyl-(acyl-carrier-protein) reductase [Thermoleophilia bacterium]
MSRGGALVTGSATGIGRGIALALAREGYDVAVHYRRSGAEAEATRSEIEALGVRAITLQADVTDSGAAAMLVQETHDELGSLAVLVNNVGNYVYRPLDELSLEEWDDVFATNLDATFATCRAAVPLMRAAGGGRIVNLGYAGAQNLLARPNMTAYAIAKTGVVLLTKAIARAEAANGITANVVAPGVIENSATKPLGEIPAGREGRIEEVAAAVVYFVSPDAAYVTGQVLEVAGGWNL